MVEFSIGFEKWLFLLCLWQNAKDWTITVDDYLVDVFPSRFSKAERHGCLKTEYGKTGR